MNDRCRWGILGTAGIARKNWQAIRNSGNGRLVAVASRNKERAAAFISENQSQVPFDPPPRALGDYDEMIASDDIDALYVPLPTAIRKEFVLKAAATGKHVLCEKPCGVDAAEVLEMTQACEAAGVQFMDGVMFMHSARLQALREVLDQGEAVGEIKRIVSQFSFMAAPDFAGNIRMNPRLEPLGAPGDLGWYCIRIALWIMRFEMPLSLSANMILESETSDDAASVPLAMSAEMMFADGVTASFYCSFEAHNQQWLNIGGTRGHLTMDDFVQPYRGSEIGFNIENPFPSKDICQFRNNRNSRRVSIPEHSDSHPDSQETKLFRNFGELVLCGKTDPYWPGISLKTQRVLDACLWSAKRNGTAFRFPGAAG